MKAAMLLGSLFIMATGLLMSACGIYLSVWNATHGSSVIVVAISEVMWLAFTAAAVWWLYFGVKLFLRSTHVQLPNEQDS